MVVSAVGFTIWGVKKHLSKKSSELNQSKNDNKKIIIKENSQKIGINKIINKENSTKDDNQIDLSQNDINTKPTDDKVNFEEEVINQINQLNQNIR